MASGVAGAAPRPSKDQLARNDARSAAAEIDLARQQKLLNARLDRAPVSSIAAHCAVG